MAKRWQSRMTSGRTRSSRCSYPLDSSRTRRSSSSIARFHGGEQRFQLCREVSKAAPLGPSHDFRNLLRRRGGHAVSTAPVASSPLPTKRGRSRLRCGLFFPFRDPGMQQRRRGPPASAGGGDDPEVAARPAAAVESVELAEPRTDVPVGRLSDMSGRARGVHVPVADATKPRPVTVQVPAGRFDVAVGDLQFVGSTRTGGGTVPANRCRVSFRLVQVRTRSWSEG